MSPLRTSRYDGRDRPRPGHFHSRAHEIIDSPGINDLAPRSDDARNLLEQYRDATMVQVADAKNYERR